MKIVYCGIDVFLPVFEYLAQSTEHEIIELYTYHEESEYIRDEQINQAADRYGIPRTTRRLSAEHLRELFQSGGCDLLLSAEYDRKLPVLELENYRGMNIHNSLLPEGRGYFPVEMRLYQNYTYSGVTIHKLAERFDRGDILLQRRFALTPEACSLDVYQHSAAVALEMVKSLLDKFDMYWENGRRQAQSGGSWWPLPTAEMVTITPAMSLADIHHTVRSFCYLTKAVLNGRSYAVKHIECMGDDGKKYRSLPPASPMVTEKREKRAEEQELVFRAQDGVVRLIALELPEGAE